MGTTAQKLEYLNTTKQLIKESINLTDANITTEPFRQYATILKHRLPEILGDPSIIWNNYEHVTGSGTSFSITAYNSIFDMQLKGDTTQNGTPTPDAPIPVNVVSGDNTITIEGKNLFDKSKASINYALNWGTGANFSESGSLASDYIQTTKGEKFTIAYSSQVMYYDKNKEYLGCLQTGGQTIAKTTGNTWKYFTTPNYDEIAYMRLGIRKISDGGEDKTNKNIMLNREYVLEPYEPYTGQTYSINLGVENLFTTTLEQNARNNTDGTSTIWSANYIRTKDKIKVEPNTTYYINYEANSSFSGGDIQFYQADSTYLNNIALGNAPKSFTTPSNAYYINIQWFRNGGIAPTDITNLQLIKGDHLQYISNNPIELCKIGTYQDKIIRNKNLLDYKNLEIGIGLITPITNGWKLDSSTTQADECEGMIPITLTPNKKYYASFKVTNTTSSFVSMELYKKVGQTWTYVTSVNASSDGTYKFNFIAPSEETRIHLYLEKGTAEFTELYVGEIDGSYIPYGQTGNWYLHKEIGKVVLDGSESWSYEGGRFVVNFLITALNTSGRQQALSNYFNYVSSGSASYGIFIYKASDTNYQIYVYDNDYTTANDFKTWLTTHNTEVYYVLATPTNTEITDGSLINQLNAVSLITGLNNISVSGDLPAILDLTALKYE